MFKHSEFELGNENDEEVLSDGEEGSWNDLSFESRSKMINGWTFVLILANSALTGISCSQVGPYDANVTSESMILGIAVMLQWLSLNRYMTYSEKFSHLPKTFLGSTYDLTSGIIGVLPAVIGFSCMTQCLLYTNFRFRDLSSALFTYFYNINGDTIFNTLYPCNKIAFFITFVWSWVFVIFGISCILRISIAMVE